MAQHTLPEAADLAAAKGLPLVVLYSCDDCNWCEKVRREHLGPLSHNPAAPAVIRELHMDRATPMLDFAGRRTTSAGFSIHSAARFTAMPIPAAPPLMPGNDRLSIQATAGFGLDDIQIAVAGEDAGLFLQKNKIVSGTTHSKDIGADAHAPHPLPGPCCLSGDGCPGAAGVIVSAGVTAPCCRDRARQGKSARVLTQAPCKSRG